MKKLPPSLYKKNEKDTKFLKNELIVVYNWLKTLNLIPDNINGLMQNELKADIQRMSHLYIVDNKDLFEMFY